MKYVGEVAGLHRLEFERGICDFTIDVNTGYEFPYIVPYDIRVWQQEYRDEMFLGYGETQGSELYYGFHANFRDLRILLLFKATFQ